MKENTALTNEIYMKHLQRSADLEPGVRWPGRVEIFLIKYFCMCLTMICFGSIVFRNTTTSPSTKRNSSFSLQERNLDKQWSPCTCTICSDNSPCNYSLNSRKALKTFIVTLFICWSTLMIVSKTNLISNTIRTATGKTF